jgi:serine/threonine protein kinase/Tfp pilus assembly protein PilF
MQDLDVGHQIGPYKLLQVLGAGGMGVVYEAEQSEPVTRRVAIKILKLGMDTHSVVARFDAERQALAVMDHPGIAKVLDGGATETGRPFFVMELVHGVPLSEYCDFRRLTLSERVGLFIKLCQAVQHAHHKGVVHRDLKPSNVLVSEQDGVPDPKIIDFGVAKAIGQRLTEQTLVTQLGEAIGTPAYMSPEQAEASGMDVDSRADIYSLGVMLYEVLVGDLPVDPREIGQQAFLARLVMRETSPPTPSTRFGALGDRQGTIAEFRHTPPAELRRELKGDLDWIVMRAMDADRNRRYETANGLALDLQRYLNNEPVLARSPSVKYRVGKFVRRHRAAVVAATGLAIAVVLGLVGTSAALIRAIRAEARVAREAAVAEQVSNFLVGLFEVSDPGEALGNSVTARELLDSGAVRITDELADQPLVQARLMLTMGDAYRSLGLYQQARPMLERTLALRQTRFGENHIEVAEGLYQLGRIIRLQGGYDEAEQLYHRALTIQEARLGPDHPVVAATLLGLGRTFVARGKFDEAEPLLERSLRIQERALEPDDARITGSLGSLATLYMARGRYEEADSLFSRSLAIREKAYGSDHLTVAQVLSDLGAVRWSQGQLDDADRLFRRSLVIRARVLGPDHPQLASILNNLGVLVWTRADYEQADSLYRRALGIYEQALGPDHRRTAGAVNNLAETRWKLGDYQEGERLFRRALAVKERVLEPQHPSIAITLNGLANLLRDWGRHGEAEPLYRRALEIRESVLGQHDPFLAETLKDYATMLREVNRHREADSLEALTRAAGGTNER